MSAIALVILAGSFVPMVDRPPEFQIMRHIYWADPSADDPMRDISSLDMSWSMSFNPTGFKKGKDKTKGFDRIPVHNMSECNAYADKLLYTLKTGYGTEDEALYGEARCIYIPDGYAFKRYIDAYELSEDGKSVYKTGPFELKKLPTPQEIAKKEWDEAHPDCLNVSADYPIDKSTDDLIEAQGKVDIKCLFNEGSDGRYHASQCEVVNVTLDKSYKKKLKKLYESEFADSALEFMKKRCSMVLPGEDIHESKRLMHIDYSQKD